jgi:hypothetical protein
LIEEERKSIANNAETEVNLLEEPVLCCIKPEYSPAYRVLEYDIPAEKLIPLQETIEQ